MPQLPEFTRVFARIGLLSFGGPAAQIALMHRELVEQRSWLTESDYLRALSFCMMLPGPEAMQLATYAGWRLRGTIGGLIAGLLFVLPGALVVLILAMLYASYGDLPLAAALLRGVQAAVLAIVLHALLKISKRALTGWFHRELAVAAFLALFLFNLPFPLVVLTAGLIGFLTAKQPDQTAPLAASTPIDWSQTLRPAALWAAIWLLPLAALWLAEGGFLFEIGLLFSKLAVLTFGGAYAVLAWLTQAIVQNKTWLTLPQMIDALGLAETTPGPLILVTEFVAYLSGHGKGGVPLGLAAALIALWMTFAPCFLWIFAGAPLIARLEHAPRLSSALAAITAAVVGVIGNLSVWFALHVLFGQIDSYTLGPVALTLPQINTLDPIAAALTILATWLIFARHWGLAQTLALCAALGAIPALT